MPAHRARHLALLLLLFVGSGCSALIYEIVWSQLLQLVIGSSAVSLGVLLGTFMGGMCLGSLVLPRFISTRPHPLRVYAAIELTLGLLGVLMLWELPAVGGLYAAAAVHGMPAALLRAAICAVCLLPPTMLMGATLPAMARWIGTTTAESVSWLGFFYGGNLAGAVLGALLAGFYLLRLFDMAVATYVASSINAGVALAALWLAAGAPWQSFDAPRHRPAMPVVSAPSVYIAVALSGLCALGAEVVWTRLLSLTLGPTVYNFSVILVVFLAGLGIGSGGGSWIARRVTRPRIAFGCCQLLLAPAIAWTAYLLSHSLLFWTNDYSPATSVWVTFQHDLLPSIVAVLPATCLWGASFPLALAAAAADGKEPGRLVGGVYAANTLGAIAGAVGFSILVIPIIGTQGAERLLVGFSAGAGLLMLTPRGSQPGQALSRLASLLAVAVVAGAFAQTISPVPAALVTDGRALPVRAEPNILFVGEGMNASFAVSELPTGERKFHVSGKVEASTGFEDMRLQRMLGNLPALVHPNPRSVLVVGFGAGVTAGSFVKYPEVQQVTICEIEPLIPRRVAPYFRKQNFDVLEDPRVHLVDDDARHYLLTTSEKFDIITSDPINPWVKGSATLYTKEYFEQVRAHLKPGGVVTQWVPLYESSLDAVKSELATFFAVFPKGTVWGNAYNGEGYDIVLTGQAESPNIDIDKMQQRLESGQLAGAAAALRDVGFSSAIDLLATYAGYAPDLVPWLQSAEINRDRNLRLQFLAGTEINSYLNASIYDEMLRYRQFPEELFGGSTDARLAVKQAIWPAAEP
jgi:spermidine synthase